MPDNDPKGPNTPNPNLTDAVNSFDQAAKGTATIEATLTKIEDLLRRSAERGDDLTKRFKNVNMELTTAVDLAGSTEEAVKEIANAAKSLRKGILDTKSSRDALATVTAIRKAQEILLKRTKDMPSAQAKVTRGMQEMNKWMEKLQHTTGEIADHDMRDLQRALHLVQKEGENVAKTFKSMSVSHLTRQIAGISGALKTAGIGKSHFAKVEKYSGMADVAFKLREAQRARFSGNKDMYRDNRDKALKAVQSKYGLDTADPKAMMLAGRTKQHKMGQDIASSMGISTKGWKQKDFIALARGNDTAATAGAAERYHGTGATGVASKLATGTEGGLIKMTEMMGEMAPALAAVEGAVMLLVEAFDAYVAQNKKMEEGLAKGGLFTGDMGGRGFTGARAGLTPDSAYTMLGLSFDRNLKIAQAISEGGMQIQDIVSAGQREEISGQKQVGPAGEGFMAGSSGMIQRAAVGAGRIAGLTDVEGVQRVIKLMGEYRETLEQGENFFVQVGKGAKGAGISVTKYIGIIDEVMQGFDRMNRSLDSTVAVMGELSKSGRLASEDMQQYFKFLTGGMGSQEQAGTSEQMFLLNRMSKSGRGTLAQNQGAMMSNLIDRAVGKGGTPAELDIPGISPDAIKKGFSGSGEQMNAFIRNTLQPAITNADVDDTRKKSWNNLVEQMRDQKQQTGLWQNFAKTGDAVGTGFGTQVQGMNMQSSVAMQQAAMEFILRQGSLKEFAAGPGEFAAKHKETAGLATMFKNNPLMIKSMLRTQELASGMRLTDVQSNDSAAMTLGKELTPMLKKKGVKIDFTSPSAFKKYFQEHGNELLDDIANLNTTTSYWGKASVKQGYEATEAERDDTRKKAKEVGAQTQSTADIFANAFSKWFINLIEGIEAIIDLMPGGDKRKRERDQERADANKFLKPSGEAFSDTQKAITELGEKAAVESDAAEFYSKKGDKLKEKQAKVAESIFLASQAHMNAKVASGMFFSPDDAQQFWTERQGGMNNVSTAMRQRLKMEQAADAATTGPHHVDNSQTTIYKVDSASDSPTEKPGASNSNEKVNKRKAKTTHPVTQQ